MPKRRTKRSIHKNSATNSAGLQKTKTNGNIEDCQAAALNGVGEIRQCCVRVKRLKLPINKNSFRKNESNQDVPGSNIKLKKCVVKLKRLKSPPSETHKNALSSGACTVPQAKNAESFTLKQLRVRVKRVKTEKLVVHNNSCAIELPRSVASPLLCSTYVMQLDNITNKNILTRQITNSPNSNSSHESITRPHENGHEMSTNQPTPDRPQSSVHIINGVSPETPMSITEDSSENFIPPNKLHRIAEIRGTTKTSKLSTIKQKFFQKKKQISTKSHNFKSKNLLSKKESISKNVYDFLSQSQNSDQEKPADPAADIIKKMINDGKVFVTTSVRGRLRCKPVTRIKKVRPIGKRKQCSLVDANKNIDANKETNENKECLMTTVFSMAPSSPPPLISPIHETSEIEEEAIFERDPEPLSHKSHAIQTLTKSNNHTVQETINLTRGELHQKQKQKLLDVARKFVSTPINKKVRESKGLNNTNISPIVGSSTKRVPPQLTNCKSPWRVPDDVPLPNTFVFGRNSSDLPSFSSDFLSKSPRKRNNETFINNRSATSTSKQSSKQHVYLPSPTRNQSSIIFGNDTFHPILNNSDGENLPPKSLVDDCVSQNNSTPNATSNFSDENQENETFVHLPNPRRTMQNRSPLKKINVLDVITLPSWKTTKQQMSNEKQDPTKTVDPTVKESSMLNEQLFGFDEFINNSCAIPLDSDNQPSTSKDCNKPTNNNLEEIYQELEDIVPTEDEMPKPTKEPLRFGYDDGIARQQDLREMFCSTMINPSKTQIPNHSEHKDDPGGDDTNNLFGDPETTFNNKQPHQTYCRPMKRVRKKRHEFLMFLDSDLSDVEEEDPSNKDQKSPKRKKQRKNKEKVELKEFVKSFNEMCKDVENYELVVE